MAHATVLLHEAIDGLELSHGDVFVDATLGNAGHSEYVLSLGKEVEVIGIDQDEDSLARAKERLAHDARISFVHENFRNLDSVLKTLNLPHIDKILFDFGFSSDQMESSGRGFSFQRDEPLLMTFKKETKPGDLTAYEIVNAWSETDIKTILFEYGEERFAGRIARTIVESRKKNPIGTTKELVDVILLATPKAYQRGRISPATRTFQALRIAVNDELGAIREALPKALSLLTPGGRIAAISFHSLEDRIVKHTFREWSKNELGTVVTKRPITPTEEEIQENPRSRSAKLRIFEKQ